MLKVNNLEISFKTRAGVFAAVKGISFQVNKGETLGIVGESGSGKSVTSLSLMRLHDAGSTIIKGSILLDDIDLLQLNEAGMRRIRGNRMAMIFQEPMTS